MRPTIRKSERFTSIQFPNAPFRTLRLNQMRKFLLAGFAAMFASLAGYGAEQGTAGLIGYWKLQGDCRDYSGHGNHGVNHGVKLDSGAFDGISAHIEVPGNASLKFCTGDFALCAWIYTKNDLDDVVGDVLDLHDPSLR